MQADGAVHFAAATEQMAQRELRLDRVLVDFGDLQEDFDRLVLLLVEQVVQASEVSIGQARNPRAALDLATSTTGKPASGGSGGNQQ